MKKDKQIKITNLNLATFLYAKGQIIVGVSPIAENLKEFSFVNSIPLVELVGLYKFGDRDDERLLVEVHRYEQARRDLLDRLKD